VVGVRGEVTFDPINAHCTEFRGDFLAVELYKREFGRMPLRNARTRSWIPTPARAADFAVALERGGWLVTYTRPPSVRREDLVDRDQDNLLVADEALW